MMAFKIGTTDISSVYLGTTEIKKIYLGTSLVYELSSGQVTTPAITDSSYFCDDRGGYSELNVRVRNDHSATVALYWGPSSGSQPNFLGNLTAGSNNWFNNYVQYPNPTDNTPWTVYIKAVVSGLDDSNVVSDTIYLTCGGDPF